MKRMPTFIRGLSWAMAAALPLLLSSVSRAHDASASPLARVMQRVGDGEVTVEYSSPGVKKRQVWGDLVTHGKLWRTGANASTKITFTKDVTFGTTRVPAGTYSLLSIPQAKTWTVILNRNTAIKGALDNYQEKDDVVRLKVSPVKVPFRERLTFIFSDVTGDSVSLDLEWEKLRVRIPIKTVGSAPPA